MVRFHNLFYLISRDPLFRETCIPPPCKLAACRAPVLEPCHHIVGCQWRTEHWLVTCRTDWYGWCRVAIPEWAGGESPGLLPQSADRHSHLRITVVHVGRRSAKPASASAWRRQCNQCGLLHVRHPRLCRGSRLGWRAGKRILRLGCRHSCSIPNPASLPSKAS
jgi:hypothetical protein